MDFTLSQIADCVGGELFGDDRVVITGVGPLMEASEGQISFFTHPRYKDHLAKTKASAVIVSRQIDLFHGAQIVVSNPALAYARVAALFAPPPERYPGVSDRAFIHERAVLGHEVSIYPFVYVGEGAEIGNDVFLFPGVYVGEHVKVGERTILFPNVTVLHHCVIGKDVIIHAGCVIGADGFGFVRDGSINVKIPQTGIVQIDDHAEIGANSCIDRATMGRTWIRSGVKTDNLVQIAHNVVVGEDTVIVAQAAVAGSVRIGRQVVIGGQAGISDHLDIADKVMIGSQAGVAKSLTEAQVVSGTPAMPHRLWLKTRSLITRLPDLFFRLRNLETRVVELEKRAKGE